MLHSLLKWSSLPSASPRAVNVGAQMLSMFETIPTWVNILVSILTTFAAITALVYLVLRLEHKKTPADPGPDHPDQTLR